MLEKYFKRINVLRIAKEKAYKKYIEEKEQLYSLSGVKYSDMPKGTGKALGFDDLLGRIEELLDEYIRLDKEYNEEYESCMNDINKLNDPVYSLIIEYSFIELKKDKDILNTLSSFHNIDISYSHLRRKKINAINEFKRIINTK